MSRGPAKSMTCICRNWAPAYCTVTHRTPSQRYSEQASSALPLFQRRDAVSGRSDQTRIYRNSRRFRCLAPGWAIEFESDHTPRRHQRNLVTPPPVSSKAQRSGLVHIIGKDPPKIPNLFGDFATIVPDDDSQEQ